MNFSVISLIKKVSKYGKSYNCQKLDEVLNQHFCVHYFKYNHFDRSLEVN